MSLLPSSREAARPESDPEVVGLGDDRSDELLDALSSATARTIVERLHESPATPTELAETVDTSLQNVHHHLNALDEADAVEVVDTAYSAKGREMSVYAPTARPLVICAGSDDARTTVADLLTRLLGAVGILTLASVAVQRGVERLFYPGGPTPVRTAGAYAAPPLENVAPPVGLYVFVVGLGLLAAWGAWRYRTLARRPR